MPATTTWERHTRRREVIQLRFEQGYTTSEISEELGWSEATINRDLDRIREQTARMGEPTVLRDHVFASVRLLLTHEFDDLKRANLRANPEEKHRSKTSLRKTLRLLVDLHKAIASETPSGDERIDELPERAQEILSEVAATEIEESLSTE